MNYEQQYYDFEGHWDPKILQEKEFVRVKDIIKNIPGDVKSILDAGCGNGILCNQLKNDGKENRRIVGLERSPIALKFVNTEKCLGDITEMPFRPKEFDIVILSEVLEHLPFGSFQKAKSEIARVAKDWILITVPKNDKLRYNMAECPRCLTKFNRAFHMRTFTKDSLRNIFDEFGFKCEILESAGIYKEYIFLRTIVLFYRYIIGTRYSINNSICPLCGFTKRKFDKRSLESERSKNMTLKKIMKKIWPSLRRRHWLLALYKRS